MRGPQVWGGSSYEGSTGVGGPQAWMVSSTSIQTRSITRRVTQREAPQIQKAQALHCQNKNKPHCCATNVVNNLSLSTRLLDTCAYISVTALAPPLRKWLHLAIGANLCLIQYDTR